MVDRGIRSLVHYELSSETKNSSRTPKILKQTIFKLILEFRYLVQLLFSKRAPYLAVRITNIFRGGYPNY